jgi:hypothetical protein
MGNSETIRKEQVKIEIRIVYLFRINGTISGFTPISRI